MPEARNDTVPERLFYDIYPYLCGTVFLIGSWLRYDYGQYTWRASSSQMLAPQYVDVGAGGPK
ncbi:hypothetical protein UA70_18395 [Raoultella planticola]|nr:hypothetical protein UA70_18395 [Raoultella planticola]